MVNLIIMVAISTIVFALIIEVHCRLQSKIIAKPRTMANLIKHYLMALPVVLLMLLYFYEIRSITVTLGLSELNGVFLDLCCVIIFISPLLYIMDWRYPGLMNKMENWRKNT